jgi:6,7-dimethyl-8-ribityllumazine synthase
MGIERGSDLRLDGRGLRIAVIASRFNAHIVDPLVEGATAALIATGVARGDITILRVPGAIELPIVAQKAAQSGRFAGIVALGAVIRGETAHFDYVNRVVHDGLLRVSLDAAVPVTMGVLACDTEQQALDRIGGSHGHKGAEAAQALIETLQTLAGLE